MKKQGDMVDKEKVDKRVIRTKQFIQEALIQLIDEKPYKDIQIMEIAELAGVARQTIHRNYGTKDAIIIEGLDRIHEELLAKISAIPNQREKVMCTFLESIAENKRFLLMIHKAKLDFVVMDKFTTYLQDYIAQNSEETSKKKADINRLITMFLSGGIYMFYRDFISDKTDLSPKQYSALFYDLTKRCHYILDHDEWSLHNVDE